MKYSKHAEKLHIRPFAISDYVAIKNLSIQLKSENISLVVHKSKLDSFINDSSQLMLIAENIEGELVGIISAGKMSNFKDSCRWLELFVDKNWRGKGVGSSLLKSLILECNAQQKIKRLNLSVMNKNLPAFNLYKSNDFLVEKNFFSLFYKYKNMYFLTS